MYREAFSVSVVAAFPVLFDEVAHFEHGFDEPVASHGTRRLNVPLVFRAECVHA